MSTTAVQQLDSFKQLLEKVKARRTRIQIQLEAARQQYATAAAEAQREYKTESLPKLKAKLAELVASNEQAALDFNQAVAEFEKYITKIEQALSNPEAMAELVASMSVAPPVVEAALAVARPASVEFAEEDI